MPDAMQLEKTKIMFCPAGVHDLKRQDDLVDSFFWPLLKMYWGIM